MREIVVISGKGGTGKTSVCASLAWRSARPRPSPFPKRSAASGMSATRASARSSTRSSIPDRKIPGGS